MLESFFYAIQQNLFLQNAIIAIFLLSITSGIIGSLLVSNKIVFVGGGVAHCAYGGIGIAIFYGFSILLGASISAIVVALVLSLVKNKFGEHVDTFSAILWALGMSIGVLFINLSPNANADIESYLFGSLISVDRELIQIICVFNLVLIAFICFFYKKILFVSYDSEFCKLKGVSVHCIMNAIFIFIAIGVIFSMQISGLILVLAMLSIPAYISNIFVKTLKMQMVFSSCFACIFMLLGLFFAYQYNILSGATITIVAVISMICIHAIKWCISSFQKG